MAELGSVKKVREKKNLETTKTRLTYVDASFFIAINYCTQRYEIEAFWAFDTLVGPLYFRGFEIMV